MKDVMVEGNFVVLGVHPNVCPLRVVISANRHRLPATQRTVCVLEGEDGSVFWARVLATVRAVATRLDPYDPWTGTHGGCAECFYDHTFTDAECQLIDGRDNLLRMMQFWATSDSQPIACRVYATDFLDRWAQRQMPHVERLH